MRGILLVTFWFVCLSSFSQSVISFQQRLHEFGTIKEVEGAVSYDFEFVNAGNTPVLIKNVESSCGCTSPEWTRQPILPGKKGFVRATFDPKDRPGYFDKTITVYSNARPAVIELKIKGTVEGKTRTVLDDFPYELPSGLRLPLEHLSLMKAKKGEVKTMEIGIYNNAGKAVAVSFAGLPPHLQLSVEPQQVPDRGKATIKAAYNTALKGEYGLNQEEIVLTVDGKKYSLPLSIFIEEDFSKVNLAEAPLIDAGQKYFNFGKVAASQGAGQVYRIRNTGRAPLKIYRVYANDGRIKVGLDRKELQPGESAEVSVKILPGAESGKVTGVVSVISNCPATFELNLRFYGEIE